MRLCYQMKTGRFIQTHKRRSMDKGKNITDFCRVYQRQLDNVRTWREVKEEAGRKGKRKKKLSIHITHPLCPFLFF